MFKKKTYKIKFTINFIPIQKDRFLPDYKEITPGYLYARIYNFCMENNIKYKKLKTHDSISDLCSYVKIYGTKNDQIKLYNFLLLNFSKYITLRPL